MYGFVRRIDLGPCDGLLHERDGGRCVVVLPGMRYSTQAPLLWFAREVAGRQGFSVLEVLDALPDGADGVEWAQDRASRALEAAPDGDVVVVGKSLASTAAGLVAERDLAAVWLTPLLDRPVVTEGLARVTRPVLLVGGTADATWAPEALPASPLLETLELDGLDHSLQRPGDLDASFAALRTVTGRISRFLHAAAG
jgi:pimeloyl-ACP methyl ester carboxylesterase